MKVFLDTSALAKRYIQEPGSEELEELFLSSASDVIVSTLALPEFAAALGRKMRDREIGKRAGTKAMKELEQDWNNLFIKIPITDSVALAAASLAIKYPFKGAVMWFKRNGHFAKNDKNESEVPYEFSKNKATLHSRV